jgi:hypothetical protein
MPHTATEVIRSPTITNLTIQSACRNSSHIESGAADGMASPSGYPVLPASGSASTTGVMGQPSDKTGTPSGVACAAEDPKLRKAGPHR